MKLSIFGLLISSTLCGCAMFDEETISHTNEENLAAPYSTVAMATPEASTTLESSLMFQRQFQQNMTKTNSAENMSKMEVLNLNNEQQEQSKPTSDSNITINNYAKSLMRDLVGNLQYVNSKTPVAVVSFVMLDTDYNQSSLVGNQMAESLIHEIHEFGIPVIDFKTTGFIRITEQGDFAFTRDYQELPGNLAAKYIVGGTMVKLKDGYLVNGRIVGLQSRAVVASAQSFIPNNIIDAIMPNSTELTKKKLMLNSPNVVSIVR
jgi:TolB-like protein